WIRTMALSWWRIPRGSRPRRSRWGTDARSVPSASPARPPACWLVGPISARARPAVSQGRSAEPAGPADGLVGGMAVGDLDVVDDGAVSEPDQPVAAGGDLRVVGSDDDRHLVLAPQPGQQVKDGGGATGVQVAGRLVGEKQVRGVDQRPRDGDPLLFAA